MHHMMHDYYSQWRVQMSELKPLWSDGKSESMIIDEGISSAVFNLHEDIQCLKEQLDTHTSKNELTYQQAKKAVDLFESEYVGQDQSELWNWAINEVIK